ncbi:MAG: aminotransferase class V-fold PLP-dependent enzyme [Verrucomicrobia bacterium]|nr:aminotransferase class V-fold PLP-dependent enzyme [Verrucomicrobiota bacterium]
MTDGSLTFKIASTESEFEQIFRLNYRTFVEEIPQHPPNAERRLVDRFHHQNSYLIALNDDELVGMMAVRDQRPFSLDEKLGSIDTYLPPGRSVCEIRLLSVIPTHRTGSVFQGLLKLLLDYGIKKRYNLAVISGTVRQQKLYKHLGFTPFGPLVGPPEAQYQPMYLTIEGFRENAAPILNDVSAAERSLNPISLLPGPVSIREEVRQALIAPATSHRAEPFKVQLAQTQQHLCQLVQAKHVEIMLGSGTLANDAIAAQLSLQPAPGLVLSNGEFGSRLIDHARRFRLTFTPVELEWGQPFDPQQLTKILDSRPETGWLWTTACETSTGVLNDLPLLQELCVARGIKLCLDAISAIGVIPLRLDRVYLASGVSGKGLGAFPGLSMVFYQHDLEPRPDRLPRYLDLGFYARHGGIPFTQSSNLLMALWTALKRYDSPQPFAEVRELSAWLRPRLRELGLRILAPDEHAAPNIITLVPPPSLSAEALGDQLLEAGFLVSYQSDYLRNRNWLQICLMGECSRAVLVGLLTELKNRLTNFRS